MKEEGTYPKSSFIKLFDNKRTYFYEIIKEGTYPLTEQLHYTRNPKHPIPHNYVVKTQYGKAMYTVECSIEYVEKKPLYKICFGVNFSREVHSWETSTDAACKYYQEFNGMKEMEKNRNRDQSNKENKGKISGPLLFGLKLLSVERVRRTMSLDLKIRPFIDFGNSQKRRRILGLSQSILDIVERERDNTFHPDDQIKLKQIKFEIDDDVYDINFGKVNKIEEIKKIEAVVKSLDKGHISREAYRSLARIEDLPCEKAVCDIWQKINAEMKKQVPLTLVDLLQPTKFEPIREEPNITDSEIITNMLESIGKGGQRRITDILNYIIPLYIEKGILIPRQSTLHIRISGNGHNVGRKVKHVMVTMTLLNDLNGLQKPDNHYTLVLYPGAETYESLKNVLTPLISDLCILKEKGFNQIGGNQWPVELYFSSDWKFLAICLGMNAANAQYFCLWCDCNKNSINTTSKKINKSMDNIKVNYKQINGHIKEPLFHMIPLQNWVVDELHIFLRITDRLWELMISDLRRETANEEIWKGKILSEMQRLNISFQFWHEKNTNNLSYTSLMGPDKLKVLKEFDLFAVFQSITQAIQIRALWDQFNELYHLIQDKKTTGEFFRYKAKSWLDEFTAPSTGHPNRDNFVRGMYRIQDITPYIHVLCNHVAEFLEIHHKFGLAAFSCFPVEKKNHMQVCLYFQNTLKDGGNRNSRKSAILEMLEHENRQLYFASNRVPNFFKKSKKYRLE
ncbi:hypothetical protein RhiirA1_418594 [Rhizophagus irregularis]|uniref:Uncharacterized protein n=1 Tax=Rhizophagus irregularis TaxID=588596 RepID=A0A2N0RUS4_9GLOM|nr:hypothetical protein RhiirA1_418594 [Rhizophagus irregularis]